MCVLGQVNLRVPQKTDASKKKEKDEGDAKVAIHRYLCENWQIFKYSGIIGIESLNVFLNKTFQGSGDYTINGDVRVKIEGDNSAGGYYTIDTYYQNCSVSICEKEDGEFGISSIDNPIYLRKKGV